MCSYGIRCILVFTNHHGRLAFEKIFQAVGRMKVSMIALLGGCITNIILDPF